MNDMARLRWRCRRGMRELDLLFDRFLEAGYSELTEAERLDFDRLLACQDDQLYDWFYQGMMPEDEELARLVRRITAVFQR